MMTSMEQDKPRPRRSFTPEFKAEIVERCRRGDRSIGQVARDFDLTETAVREWVRQADVDAGKRDGLTTAEREELAQLRRENRRLREDVEIDSQACDGFLREGDPVKMDPFIEAEEAQGHSIARCCVLFQVSRAAYYQRRRAVPSARALADQVLTAHIRTIHAESAGTYGSPRVHHQLRKHGTRCGRRRVARLMRQAGLEGCHQRRRRTTTIQDPTARTADLDLIQGAFGPGQNWNRRDCGDITYVATWEGWAYLATVIDLDSRRVVGWSLGDHLRTKLVTDALEVACARRRPAAGTIFHSDRGCQYTSAEYHQFAQSHGVVLSLSRTGDCFDNAVAESCFATLKRELIHRRAWPTRAGLRRALFDYIEGWYNTRRLHSSLGYRSPAEYEATLHGHARQQAA